MIFFVSFFLSLRALSFTKANFFLFVCFWTKFLFYGNVGNQFSLIITPKMIFGQFVEKKKKKQSWVLWRPSSQLDPSNPVGHGGFMESFSHFLKTIFLLRLTDNPRYLFTVCTDADTLASCTVHLLITSCFGQTQW